MHNFGYTLWISVRFIAYCRKLYKLSDEYLCVSWGIFVWEKFGFEVPMTRKMKITATCNTAISSPTLKSCMIKMKMPSLCSCFFFWIECFNIIEFLNTSTRNKKHSPTMKAFPSALQINWKLWFSAGAA